LLVDLLLSSCSLSCELLACGKLFEEFLNSVAKKIEFKKFSFLFYF
jgi:hypothetical protein